MPRFDSPLKNIHVASPCSADWSEMYGDDRKRFCGDCKLNVYNLSGMTTDEAEALVINAEGSLCVRFYRRVDGSVITQDCPVGWTKVKQRTKLYATAIASLVIALFTGVLFASLFSKQKVTVGMLAIPFATPSPKRMPLMGAIAGPRPDTNSNTEVIQGKPSMGNMVVESPKTRFEKAKVRAMAGDVEKDS